MNQQTFKTARISSCSTKKSSIKQKKSSSQTKKNLQNTFTKMSIPSAVICNNSVLTQRNNTHEKCKANLTNPENQNTRRIKSSSKKLPKTISTLKTDRKAQYTKLKAKQIENQLERKASTGKKGFKKINKQPTVALIDKKPLQQALNSAHYESDLGKICNLTPSVNQFTQIKHNSDSFVLSEIEKNQKQLIEKISFLQKQNCNLSQRNDSIINDIKYKHDEQVTTLKQEMKILHCKLNQQGNKNSLLEKKTEYCEKDYVSLRDKINEKDQRIIFLQKHNKQLEQDLNTANYSLKGYENQVNALETNITNLKSVKSSIEEQLKKCEKEKQYIKENCIQVLSILREEFGDQLKLFSF